MDILKTTLLYDFYGELLTDNAIGIHDFHPLLLCYITKYIDKKW